MDSAMEAGKVRSSTPVILEVDAKKAIKKGIVILKAGKTVYLAKEVPPKFLSKFEE